MSERMRERCFRAAVLLYLPLLAVLALANRGTFPLSWNDETSFDLPALWWAAHGTLEPLTMNAPHGLFWVPDGFTLLLGLAHRGLGRSFLVAQNVCLLCCAMGVALLAMGVRRKVGSRRVAVAVLLCGLTPPVVFAANMVRMEAVLFLLLGAAVLLDACDLRVEAAAALLLTLLFHPAAVLAFAGYTACALYAWSVQRPRRLPGLKHWVLPALVLVAMGAEVVRYAAHRDLVAAHIGYQALRKADRTWAMRLWRPQVALFAAILVPFSVVAVQGNRWRGWLRNGDAAWLAMPLGLEAYAIAGAELPYTPYMLFWCPVLLIAFCYRALGQRLTPNGAG